MERYRSSDCSLVVSKTAPDWMAFTSADGAAREDGTGGLGRVVLAGL
jgi:hypothetical protein